MDALLYLTALRRRWRLILGLTALGLVVGFVTGSDSSDSATELPAEQPFEATHTLAVVDPVTSSRQGRGDAAPSDPRLDTIPLLLSRGAVPERVAALLGAADDPNELASRVHSSTDTGLGTLDIIATDPDPARAVAIADAFAQALLEHLSTQVSDQTEARAVALDEVLVNLQAEIDRLSVEVGADPTPIQQTQLDAFLDRYRSTFDQLQSIRTEPPSPALLDLVDATASRQPATEDDSFSTPSSRTGRALIGGLAGLLVGVLLAVVIDRLDTSIRTAEAAEAALGMPVLASVPPLPRRFRRRSALPATGTATDFDEALRLLRATLMVAGGRLLRGGDVDGHGAPALLAVPEGRPDPQLRTLLVTSANPSEGKSTLVASLARTMGLAPSRVIVLDLDLRQPALHKLLGGPSGPGIAELFAAAEESTTTDGDHTGGADDDRRAVATAAPAGGFAVPSPVAGTLVDPAVETGPRGLDDILVEVAPGVRLAPAGSAVAPTQLLAAGSRLVLDARARCDIVLIDAPPLLAVSEPSELLPAIDGVIVAVFAGRSTAGDALALSERLALLGAPVIGAVLIGATPGSRSRRADRRYGVPSARRERHAAHENGAVPPVVAAEEPMGIGGG